jgi:lysophospholipase L1-like esterase
MKNKSTTTTDKKKKDDDVDDEPKVLVMLGDSITHQTLSGRFCEIIQKDASCSSTSSAKNPLTVVNCGQNSILTYTVLKERVDWVVACNPSYVSVMVGTNDIKGIYNKEWGVGSQATWNIDEPVSFLNFEKNLIGIVERILEETGAVVGLNTLVMLGEDLNCKANTDYLAKANSIIKGIPKKLGNGLSPRVTIIDCYSMLEDYLLRNSTEEQRSNSLKVDDFSSAGPSIALKTTFLGSSFDDASKQFGLTVMVDALHLNDVGARIVADGVLGWLAENYDNDYVNVEK